MLSRIIICISYNPENGKILKPFSWLPGIILTGCDFTGTEISEHLRNILVENFSGAIYVKEDKRIPFINTALSRVNQYFAAWHELYHLIFNEVSFDHPISKHMILKSKTMFSK